MGSLGYSCLVCMDQPRAVRLEPCGHAYFCYDCATRMPRAQCPVCRTMVENLRPVKRQLRTNSTSARQSFNAMRELTRTISFGSRTNSPSDLQGLPLRHSITVQHQRNDRFGPKTEPERPRRILFVGTRESNVAQLVWKIRQRFPVEDAKSIELTGHHLVAEAQGRPNAQVDEKFLRIKAFTPFREELDQQTLNSLKASQPDVVVFCFSESSLPSFEKVVQWDLGIFDDSWDVQRIWVQTTKAACRGSGYSRVSLQEVQNGINYVSGQRACVACRLDTPYDRGVYTIAQILAGKKPKGINFGTLSARRLVRTLKSMTRLASTISNACRQAFKASLALESEQPLVSERDSNAPLEGMNNEQDDSLDGEREDVRNTQDLWHDANEGLDHSFIPLSCIGPATVGKSSATTTALQSTILLSEFGLSVMQRMGTNLIRLLGF